MSSTTCSTGGNTLFEVGANEVRGGSLKIHSHTGHPIIELSETHGDAGSLRTYGAEGKLVVELGRNLSGAGTVSLYGPEGTETVQLGSVEALGEGAGAIDVYKFNGAPLISISSFDGQGPPQRLSPLLTAFSSQGQPIVQLGELVSGDEISSGWIGSMRSDGSPLVSLGMTTDSGQAGMVSAHSRRGDTVSYLSGTQAGGSIAVISPEHPSRNLVLQPKEQ